MARDITERKLAEDELQRYKRIFSATPDLLSVLDRNYRHQIVNDAYLRVSNKNYEEIIGHHVREIIGEQVFERIAKPNLDRCLAGETTHHEAWYEFKAAGRCLLSVTYCPYLDADNKISGVLVSGRDITQLKRAEQALRESEARYHGLYDSIRDGVVLTDMSGLIQNSNAAYLEMLGYSEEEIKRVTYQQLTPSKWHKMEQEIVAKQIATRGYSDEYEKEYIRKDGTIVPISMRVWLIKDDWDNPLGMWGIVRDITEQKCTERELRAYHDNLEELVRRRTEELEERNFSLSREIADRKRAEEAFREVSHRLYQVRDEEGRRVARELHDSVAQELAAIVMKLGSLEDMLPRKNTEARSLLARTLSVAEKCSQEVRTLSYLLHPPLLDQLGLVSALRSYVEGFSRRSGISVAVEAPTQCDRLPAEVELTLFRVTQESLGNIHRHSGSTTARIQLTRQADCVVLEVSDEGCGISPDMLTSIQQYSSVGGVGIPGMQERLRLLNGTLSVESSSCGTTIHARIPLVSEAT